MTTQRKKATFIGPIEVDTPMPNHSKWGALRRRLAQLKAGQSFITSLKADNCHMTAARLGISIVVRTIKQRPGHIRVWRLM